jgi:PAS domain S-box-containing protein
MIEILYIDDETDLLDVGKSHLEMSGEFHIDTALSLQGAMEKVERVDYDGIIADHHMPSLNSIGLLKKLRSEGNFIPFILFTGRGQEEVAIEALNSGADFYLQKGSDPQSQFIELQQRLRETIWRKAAERAPEKRLQQPRSFDTDPNRFEALFSAYNEGVALHEIVYDDRLNAIDYLILEVNPAFEKITGIPKEESVGKLASMVYGSGNAPHLDIYSKVAISGESTSFETFIPPLNKYFSISVFSPARGRFATVLMDVTESKKVYAELRQSEERYRTYVDYAMEGVFVVDREGRYRDANQAACDLVGYTREELLDLTIADLTPPDQMGAILSKFKELMERGTISLITELRKKDLSSVPVHLNAVQLPNGNLMAFCADITEIKQAQDKLSESERCFRALFEGNGDATWVIDQGSGRFIDANPAALNMYGYSKEEFTKLVVYDVSAEPEKTYHAIHSVHTFIPLRYHKRKDGSVFPVEIVTKESSFGGRPSLISTARDISERERAQEALKESEARYRSLFQDNCAPMLLIDPSEGDIVDANEAACTYYGYKRSDLLQMNLSKINMLSPAEVRKEMGRSIRGEKGKFEFQHRMANGDVREVEVYRGVITLQNRTLLYSIVHDVTDRKRVAEALSESELKFREIFNHANDAIYLNELGPDLRPGAFIDVNEAACIMLGYSREELLRMSPGDLVEQGRQYGPDEMARQMSLKGVNRFEEVHRRHDGGLVPVEINSHFVKVAGRLMTISVVRDITDRKRTEEEQRLREETLRLVLTSAPFPLIIANWDGSYILDANTQATAAFGLEIGQGQRLADLFLDDDQLEKILRILSSHGSVDGLEVPLRAQGGEPQWHILSARTVAYPGEERLLLATYNITERRMMEKALHEANTKLGILNSITRHDILNQMTVLNGYLELGMRREKDPAITAYFDIMFRAAENVQRQIVFTKDYQEMGVKAPLWVSVSRQTNDAFAMLHPPGIKLEDTTDGVEVLADQLAEKVPYNLIDNSMRHGERVTRIRMSAEAAGESMLIVYQDDGVGIGAKDRARLFEKGFGKNTGLGLFLVREILSITGITIEERGQEGCGVRFEMRVPPGAWRRTTA